MRRGIVIFAAGLTILVAALTFEWWQTRSGEAPLVQVSIGGPFTLTDQTGKPRRDAEFRGKLMLVYFGYAYCPDVCPTELQTMSEALEQLGPKAVEVQPVFITIDPERDTAEQLATYAQNFDPRFVMLTGSEQQVAEAARGYKVYYRRTVKADGEIQVDHSSFVYLMGRDGRYVSHFGPGTKPEAMAAAIQKRL
jgi:protein SCO1/2